MRFTARGDQAVTRRSLRVGVRVDGEHVRRVAGDADRKPVVTAAELEHTLSPEVAQPPQGGEMGAFRVEYGRHVSSPSISS